MKKDDIIGGILLLGFAGGGVVMCGEALKYDAELAEERREAEEFDEICRCSIPDEGGVRLCAPCEEVDCYHEHGWDNKRCETAEGRAELYREREEEREESMRALKQYERDLEDEPIHVSNSYESTEESVVQSPKEQCLDTYLGATYKKDTCNVPFYGKVSSKSTLDKKFASCNVGDIIKGKGNTATANAICNGLKVKINMKNFQVRRNGR